jgi:hypothetical protein
MLLVSLALAERPQKTAQRVPVFGQSSRPQVGSDRSPGCVTGPAAACGWRDPISTSTKQRSAAAALRGIGDFGRASWSGARRRRRL